MITKEIYLLQVDVPGGELKNIHNCLVSAHELLEYNVLLTLSKSTLWYRMSCVACRLKLSSTFEKGQMNKCKRATAINKNSSGSPKRVPFSAMTAQILNHFRSKQEVQCFIISLKHIAISFFINILTYC